MKNSYQRKGKHALFTQDIYVIRINQKANRFTTCLTKLKLVSLLSIVMSLGIIHLVRTQNFPKRVRNISFSENFTYVLNGWSPVVLVYVEPLSNIHAAAFLKGSLPCIYFRKKLHHRDVWQGFRYTSKVIFSATNSLKSWVNSKTQGNT